MPSMSATAASSDICGTDVQALYLEDPGNTQEPAGYVLCSEMGNTCMKNGCSCRSTSSATVNGATKYFGMCVVLKSGADCVTSGDDYVTCATGSGSSGSSSISGSSEAQNESSTTRAPTTKAATESKSVSSSSASSSTSTSASGEVDVVKVSSTAASASSMSTTVIVVIIVVAVVFVALVSWVVRAYCMRRASDQSKLASRRNRSNRRTNFEATSPTVNGTNRSSATPSFPAFDRRTRAMQSPTTARGRGTQDQRAGRNTPRAREPNSGRGRRNPDIEFGPTGGRREPTSGRGRPMAHEPSSGRGRPMTHEPTSGRGRRNPEMEFAPAGPRREPTSGRGQRVPDIDAQFAPHGPRGFPAVGMAPREPTSGRGLRTPDLHPVEAALRTPPRDQRVKQQLARNNAPEPSGGTVYTGRNTYERVAQFAQLAAFEAPPPPPPRPQKPIQPVPVSNPVPNYARGPAPLRPSRPTPNRFHIPNDPLPEDYDILSPKTARSLAPSVASSATTVIAPGRNRPTPLQQNRRQQYSTATPSYYQSGYSLEGSKYDESRLDESKFDESKFAASTNYDDSFVSEVTSDMAWSGASGLSDDSYYHAAGTNTAHIPVIDVPHDDDDDDDSDWGHSTQQSNDFRSTAASDRSFFSVSSDFTDSKSTVKEREF